MSTPTPNQRPSGAIPLAYAVPADEPAGSGLRKALSILIGVSLASIMGTWAGVIFVDTGVVLGGGPVIGAVSLGTIVLAILARRPLAMLPAVMHIAVCVGLFLLIWLAEWGPGEARMPLVYTGLGYLAFAVPATIFGFAKASGERPA